MLGFQGDEFFLHNGYPALVEYEGVFYPTVEHAFAASGTSDVNARAEIRHAFDYRMAAALGRRFQETPPKARHATMVSLVRQKLTLYTHLAHRLLQTGKRPLVHEDRNDLYYGTFGGRGENALGKILMDLRREMRGWV